MKSVEYNANPFKYILMRYLAKLNKKYIYGSLSLAKLVEKKEPRLRGSEWVKIRVLMSGVCGSDIGALEARQSLYLEPYMSRRFVLGHENIGIVDEIGSKVKNFELGDRVAVQPFLGCRQRGIKQECRYCKSGNYALCENVNEGKLSKGISIGLNKDTGGGWSEYFLAHHSSLFKLPKEISNEEGAMIDSFSCALHPVMRNMPKKDDVVLVYGCGTIGLNVIASLRALGFKNGIIALCTRSFQKEMAIKLGADVIINPRKENLFEKIAKITKAKLYKATIGKPAMEGGVDVVYDCVATSDTINNSLRFLRGQGKLVVVATAASLKRIDFAPIWFRELNVVGSCEQGIENYKGRAKPTYKVAIDLIKNKKVDLKQMVTHKFPIKDYKKAIRTAMDKDSGSIKVVLYNDKI